MVDGGDPVWDDLHRELRRLRVASHLLDPDTWTDCIRLRECLGRGNLDQAMQAMQALRDQYIDHADSNLQAFFLTCRGGVAGDTLDARWRNYSAQFHVVPKTALRRSDRGAAALASLIRDEASDLRPRATVLLVQCGWLITVTIDFEAPRGVEVRRPHIYVNDERFQLPERPTSQGDLIDHRTVELPPTDARTLEPGVKMLAEYQVYWPMPLAADWQLLTSVADDRLMARLELRKAAFAYVSVEWRNKDIEQQTDNLRGTGP